MKSDTIINIVLFGGLIIAFMYIVSMLKENKIAPQIKKPVYVPSNDNGVPGVPENFGTPEGAFMNYDDAMKGVFAAIGGGFAWLSRQPLIGFNP